MLSLQGVSMLNCVGLSDWIAEDENDYVARAVRHASDPQSLAKLRSHLRQTTEQSPLFDTQRFTHDLENALWAMCEDHVKTNAKETGATV